jgi:hypothetical protein
MPKNSKEMDNLSLRISTTRSLKPSLHNFFIDPSYTFDVIKKEDKNMHKKVKKKY